MTTAVLPAFKAWCKADLAETEAWKRLLRVDREDGDLFAKRYVAWELAFAARKIADQTYSTAKGEAK